MKSIYTLAVAGALSAAVVGTTFADGHAEAVKERQAIMKEVGKSIGQLGKFAKGEADYDAAVAQAAADKLAEIANADFAPLLVAGSDTAVEGSRLLPAALSDTDGFLAKFADFKDAANVMQTAAGTDLAALQGAMGGLGESCGGCHKLYRQPK